MKKTLEITNLPKWFGCPHCFCISASIKTGEEAVERTEYVVWTRPVYAAHKKCCNCGATKKTR